MEATTAPVADPNNAPPRRLPLAAKLQYAYLLRVPILVGITLFVLPIVSLFAFRQLAGKSVSSRPLEHSLDHGCDYDPGL